MIATHNGHGQANGKDVLDRLVDLEEQRFERGKSRDAQASYAAGESNRMNPTPKGVDPLGTDADYHYRTERNYFLMVERGRAAVRNHPLVEQGINRLIANLKLGDNTLDVDSGDERLDADIKAEWLAWCGETQSGRNLCDYEGARSFQEIARQSFFSQVQDGDVVHLPLIDGRIQTWESHHLRCPYGHRPSGLATDGIVHGVEVRNGQTVAYHITPHTLAPGQRLASRGMTRRFAAQDEQGIKLVYWLGFRHRFYQRRGISRLSAPRDAMNGFDDLNYANIKSALRRALISYLMQQQQASSNNLQLPFGQGAKAGQLPQAGDRYTTKMGLGLESIVIEQQGEPAQVFKTPDGYSIQGWNANLPAPAFFEHSALLLTMLAVNLDLPLMFLLLDGSLVNFHGGRMTFDQAKLRFRQIQKDQIRGLWNPTYEWRIRQKITPGSRQFDPRLAAGVARGANPFKYQFRAAAWPYVKPMEDAAAEDLSERRNLRSMRSMLSDRGVDFDDHVPEVIGGRGRWAREAIKEAIAIRDEFPEAKIDVSQFFRELWFGERSPIVENEALKPGPEEEARAEAAESAPKQPRGGDA